jgi:hypothetical protein
VHSRAAARAPVAASAAPRLRPCGAKRRCNTQRENVPGWWVHVISLLSNPSWVVAACRKVHGSVQRRAQRIVGLEFAVESSARAQPSLSPMRRLKNLVLDLNSQVTPRARSIHARRTSSSYRIRCRIAVCAIYVGRSSSIHLPGRVSTMMEHNGGLTRRHLSRAELLA